MKQMIVIYVPCIDVAEATKIGTHVIKKRLAPCYNIIQHTRSAAFWPPKTGEIEEVSGDVLLIKSIAEHFEKIEIEVKKLHSDVNPCIIALSVSHVSKEYYQWLVSEMEDHEI
jgi:uncharacterized protein involved in tolerance to divalent cations